MKNPSAHGLSNKANTPSMFPQFPFLSSPHLPPKLPFTKAQTLTAGNADVNRVMITYRR